MNLLIPFLIGNIIATALAAPLPPFSLIPALIVTSIGFPFFWRPAPTPPPPMNVTQDHVNITDIFEQPSGAFDKLIEDLNNNRGINDTGIEPDTYSELNSQVDIIESLINDAIENNNTAVLDALTNETNQQIPAADAAVLIITNSSIPATNASIITNATASTINSTIPVLSTN